MRGNFACPLMPLRNLRSCLHLSTYTIRIAMCNGRQSTALIVGHKGVYLDLRSALFIEWPHHPTPAWTTSWMSQSECRQWQWSDYRASGEDFLAIRLTNVGSYFSIFELSCPLLGRTLPFRPEGEQNRANANLFRGTPRLQRVKRMNPLDSSIISFLNGFARHSVFFDTLVTMISGNDLLKGGGVVALMWATWFRPGIHQRKSRRFLIVGIIACLVSVMIARALAHEMPFRERPLANLSLHFQTPYGHSEEELIHWSSFPSDHAAVFFALAISIFFAWRAAGILALCYVFVVICLPRLYLGFHYPTDLLAGALIGLGTASLGRVLVLRNAVGDTAEHWLERSPCSFYAFCFILTFQIATLFDSTREIAHFFFLLAKFHN
jgi:undecaprenyl-diphosphatase